MKEHDGMRRLAAHGAAAAALAAQVRCGGWRRPARATMGWACALVLLGGCASTPDITVSYRPVRWSVLASVVHTITCKRDLQSVDVQQGAIFLPTYVADKPHRDFQIRLKELDRFYADADVAVALTDDGRLKSINQSTIGQGESVLKSAIGAVAALSAVRTSAPQPPGVAQPLGNRSPDERAGKSETPLCKVVGEWSGAAPGQPPSVSLVQYKLLEGATPDTGVAAAPSAEQLPLLRSLKAAGLDLSVRVIASLATDSLQPFADPPAQVTGEEVPLRLQQLSTLTVNALDPMGKEIGARSIPVPTSHTLVLPIPKAALFGKQSFALVLAESGKVTSLGYARTTGVPGAFGAAAAVAGAETAKDTAETVALKAAADLIVQQQRIKDCTLKPAECK